MTAAAGRGDPRIAWRVVRCSAAGGTRSPESTRRRVTLRVGPAEAPALDVVQVTLPRELLPIRVELGDADVLGVIREGRRPQPAAAQRRARQGPREPEIGVARLDAQEQATAVEVPVPTFPAPSRRTPSGQARRPADRRRGSRSPVAPSPSRAADTSRVACCEPIDPGRRAARGGPPTPRWPYRPRRPQSREPPGASLARCSAEAWRSPPDAEEASALGLAGVLGAARCCCAAANSDRHGSAARRRTITPHRHAHWRAPQAATRERRRRSERAVAGPGSWVSA